MDITPTTEWFARFNRAVAQLRPDEIPENLRAERERDPHGPAFVIGMMRETDIVEKIALLYAAEQVWNEPDPRVVKLLDGRQVAREFFDPAIHGPAVE